MILETLKSFREANLHTDIVFVTNDHALEEAARKVSQAERNLLVFREYPAIGEYIKTARTKFSGEFLKEAILKADGILRDLTNTDIGNQIKEKIIKNSSLMPGTSAYIRDPNTTGLFAPHYKSEEDASFHVLDTDFVSVIGENVFHWQTPIGVFCTYTLVSLPSLLGAFQSDSLQDQKKMRCILSYISWEAKVDENKNFTDLKILNIKQASDYYKSYEEFYRSNE